MIDHDRIFKELIKTFFLEFVELFLPDVPADLDRETIEFLDTVLEFNFRVIQLNRLNWRDFLNNPNPLASALMAKMRIKPKDRQQAKLECLRLILTLKLNPAKMQMLSGFVDTYLRLGEEEEKLVRAKLADLVPKEAFMEWVTPWQRWGKMDGLKEGRFEEAVTLLLRMFRRRFGKLDNDVEEKLRTLPLSEIEELSEAVFDFKVVDDLTRWLDERTVNGGDQSATTLRPAKRSSSDTNSYVSLCPAKTAPSVTT